MRIDVHAHYWAQGYLDLLIELGRTDLQRFPGQPDDLADRLAEMDAVDVDYQIFSAIGLDTVVDDATGAVTAARYINDVYADACARFDGRFRGFATVPLPHVDEAIAETERALADPAIVGVALPCLVSGTPIDDASFEPFWANLARHGRTAVYVHPVGTDSAVHPGLADWNLHTAHGSPLQIGVAPVRILLSGLSGRYPELQFVFALCGGNLPFLAPRLRRAMELGAAAAAKRGARPASPGGPGPGGPGPGGPGPGGPGPGGPGPGGPGRGMDGLKRFWFDTSTQGMPLAMAAARDSYGVDRLVLGSDATHDSLTEAVAYVQESPFLSDAEKAAILDTNAQSFLRLPDR